MYIYLHMKVFVFVCVYVCLLGNHNVNIMESELAASNVMAALSWKSKVH